MCSGPDADRLKKLGAAQDQRRLPGVPTDPELREPASSGLLDATGLTLLELMVVVGVIALLAAIAMPLYQNFMKKAKWVEAETVLRDIARLEDTYFIETGIYSNKLSDIGYAPRVQPKYYSNIRITVGRGRRTPSGRRTQIQYQVIVKGNLDADRDEDAWVLTKYDTENTDLLHGCIPRGRGWRVRYNCVD
jgi:prepilin-type N-terminal cleavage/methylation domain-containing protein